ncbi:hypothetical protein [Mesorhizobium sp.]|uniref:hypothetical protein n=1 Tax=Mesorhizobium sp. TaxID=1871066 RepID=UPI00122316A2|nr:hypothetical protein [Mesorhizobium sp.]TIT01734.1 MAG: hypothetical protein E5W87_13500 [Mesorhizobium sp.]
MLKWLFEMAETSPSGARALGSRGTVPRIVKFELRNQAPKLHLAAACELLGLRFRRIVVCAGKVDPAYKLAAFVQNVDTIQRHRLFSIRITKPSRRQLDLD